MGCHPAASCCLPSLVDRHLHRPALGITRKRLRAGAVHAGGASVLADDAEEPRGDQQARSQDGEGQLHSGNVVGAVDLEDEGGGGGQGGTREGESGGPMVLSTECTSSILLPVAYYY